MQCLLKSELLIHWLRFDLITDTPEKILLSALCSLFFIIPVQDPMLGLYQRHKEHQEKPTAFSVDYSRSCFTVMIMALCFVFIINHAELHRSSWCYQCRRITVKHNLLFPHQRDTFTSTCGKEFRGKT